MDSKLERHLSKSDTDDRIRGKVCQFTKTRAKEFIPESAYFPEFTLRPLGRLASSNDIVSSDGKQGTTVCVYMCVCARVSVCIRVRMFVYDYVYVCVRVYD